MNLTCFRKLLLLTVFCGVGVFSNFAEVDAQSPNCGALQETVSVSIGIQAKVQSPQEAKAKFDASVKDIEVLAKEAKLTQWSLQSMSYSVHLSTFVAAGASEYDLSGSMEFATDNAERAFLLIEQVAKRGMLPGVNVNVYRDGSCSEQTQFGGGGGN